jgi:hypothetical protein
VIEWKSALQRFKARQLLALESLSESSDNEDGQV